MKLSKKGAAIQRAIHDALASGNRRRASRYGGQVALGGLLIGFAATVAGCGERHSPAHTMGRFPDPRYQENATNENTEVFVTEGEIPESEEVPAQEQEPAKTNAVQELQCEKVIRGVIAPPVTTNAVNEVKDDVIVGDI